jgi:BolA protein
LITIKNRTTIITERLQSALSPSYLMVEDESDQHIGHAGHQGGERHFAVTIASQQLHSLTRVEAHRQIYALFADMIPEQIHALKIKILK